MHTRKVEDVVQSAQSVDGKSPMASERSYRFANIFLQNLQLPTVPSLPLLSIFGRSPHSRTHSVTGNEGYDHEPGGGSTVDESPHSRASRGDATLTPHAVPTNL